MTKARTQIIHLMTKREADFGRPMTPVEIADGLLAAMPSIIEALVPDLEWGIAGDHFSATTALGNYEVGDAGKNTAHVKFPDGTSFKVSPFDMGKVVCQNHAKADTLTSG